VRDTFGVPHLFGETEFDLLFGQGYVTAQDRLLTLLKAYRKAEGRCSEFFGKDWIESDFESVLFEHLYHGEVGYAEMACETRAGIDAYLEGVNQYMVENPDSVPPWAPRPTGAHVVALSRFATWSWPMRQVRERLGRIAEEGADGRGSNSWAISSKRCDEGAPILLIDPHVPWSDEWLFHEIHLTSEDGFDVFGFAIAGLPWVGMGHTASLGWSFTTGGPDCVTIEDARIDPDRPGWYFAAGEWKEGVEKEVTIHVLESRGKRSERSREFLTTDRGFYWSAGRGHGWCIRLAYEKETGLLSQVQAMNRAGNLGEFREALKRNQLMPQNLLYADRDGELAYWRVGRVPRSAGKSERGSHEEEVWGFDRLIEVRNPECGFLQNCNTSPDTVADSITAERVLRYDPVFRNAPAGGNNSRGRRVAEILGESKDFTMEQGLDLANDLYLQDGEIFRKDILNAMAACRSHDEEGDDLGESIRLFSEWNGSADARESGMTLLYFWWRELVNANRVGKENPEGFRTLERDEIANAWRMGIREVKSRFGTVNVKWGEVFRMRRGGREWPLSGVSIEGLNTLRLVGGRERGDGRIEAYRGQSAVALIQLGNPVRSYSVVPFGQSECEGSPHYIDQAEELFSKLEWKPTWHERREAEENALSTVRVRAGS